MSELKRLLIEDNGKILEVYVESPAIPPLPVTTTDPGKRPGEKGTTDEILLKMSEIQEKIQAYANFAIGAFQHLAAAEVEEITLKFGIKLGGKTGIIFTEGSAEGSMEVSVKCKFPTTSNSHSKIL
jgi:Trypsin-co-occurring domain 1